MATIKFNVSLETSPEAVLAFAKHYGYQEEVPFTQDVEKTRTITVEDTPAVPATYEEDGVTVKTEAVPATFKDVVEKYTVSETSIIPNPVSAEDLVCNMAKSRLAEWLNSLNSALINEAGQAAIRKQQADAFQKVSDNLHIAVEEV